MTRIAQMLYAMNMGGAEIFLMNMYRNIDREKYQFDFILQTDKESYYDKEIEKMGGKIYRIPRFEKHPIKHVKELYKILKDGNYEVFHRHTANSIVFIDLLIAKIAKIKIRIAHSHNTTHKNKYLNYIFRPFLYHYTTKRLSCGYEAGKWLYGNRNFLVFNNGIDIQKFVFTEDVRNKYRNDLGVKDKIVIGHVGRFDEQKNHKYLIDIFSKLCKTEDKYVLLLCGDGKLRETIKKQCEEKNISDKVFFLGIRKDVNNILQAMDLFVFPSLYEGLSITLIEAQVSNIPILMSDTIAKETVYNSNIKTIGIADKDLADWCKAIIQCDTSTKSRTMINEKLAKDYDVKSVVKQLEKIYLRE